MSPTTTIPINECQRFIRETLVTKLHAERDRLVEQIVQESSDRIRQALFRVALDWSFAVQEKTPVDTLDRKLIVERVLRTES